MTHALRSILFMLCVTEYIKIKFCNISKQTGIWDYICTAEIWSTKCCVRELWPKENKNNLYDSQKNVIKECKHNLNFIFIDLCLYCWVLKAGTCFEFV